MIGLAGSLVGGALGALGGWLDKGSAKRQRKRYHRYAGQVIAQANKAMEEAMRGYLTSPSVALGSAYLNKSFSDPLGDKGATYDDIVQAEYSSTPAQTLFGRRDYTNRIYESVSVPNLAEEYTSRIRAAQEARGFSGGGGGAGAVQEATWLARLADARRQQLLPMLGQFEQQAQAYGLNAFNVAMTPLQYYNQAPRVPSSGSIITGALQGALGGGMVGSSLGGLQPVAEPSATQYQSAQNYMMPAASAAMGAMGVPSAMGGLSGLTGLFGMYGV